MNRPPRPQSDHIDYTDLKFLKRCLTDNGKIMPARLTRLSCRQQRLMQNAVKRARFLALIPYSVD